MSIYSILSVSLLLSSLYYCIILLFPETYKRTPAKNIINILIGVSILIYFICLFLLFLFKSTATFSTTIDIKVAFIIIPSIAVFLFTANIFCPVFCIMMKQNKKEIKIATQLNRLIFQYKYQSDKRTESIEKLEVFQEANRKFLYENGVELYIPELIKQSNNAVHLAPEKLTNMLEDFSIMLLKQTADFVPNPFTNSGIVFSFAISTFLTLILSYVSIMP